MEFKYKTTPMHRRPLDTSKIMIRLLIGLMVVYVYGLYNASKWGSAYLINGILLLVVSLVVGTITEVLFALACKKDLKEYLRTSFYYITCVILVLTVPANASLYVMGVATFIALFFGKLVFGGFGQNVFNPAAVGRAVIGTSFAGKVALDAVTSPTVTAALANMNWIGNTDNYLALLNNYGGLSNILVGNYFGAIGETCTLLIIAVGIVLAIVDVIDWRIPVTYLGVMFVGTAIVGLVNGLGLAYPIAFISTGGAAFGAVFMLTDPVTDPQSRPAKIIFATVAAILTVLIRFLGNLPEGVVFSILLANMLSPTIDAIFSDKQIVAYRRNVIIVVSTVLAAILVVFLVGNSVEPGTYKTEEATVVSVEVAK